MCETVDSSMVRMVIRLANLVMGRIFSTGEREAERYVTVIVCWQHIVLGDWIEGVKGRYWGIVCWQQVGLGWLDRGREGKGVG